MNKPKTLKIHKCEHCGNNYFDEKFVLRQVKISSMVLQSVGKNIMEEKIPAYFCSKCGKILKETDPFDNTDVEEKKQILFD